ncbi:MAG: PLP-dependent aminotransferase family protein [Chloroflexi bacterium]|nr:PLP-dependent aminotransferase family protein [Chloroflexota bacterium]
MSIPWAERYALRMQRIGSSVIRELLKFTTQPDVISFAGGLPAAELFPLQAFQQASERVLQERGASALQYSITEGYLPLREWLCAFYARQGVQLHPDNILMTSGSAQALYLTGKIFINAGDPVLVERPTFLGALQAWNGFQASYVSVPLDDHGIRPDELGRALRVGPRFAYVIPTFQNPSGATMSLDRRQHLLELLDHYGVPVLEDDPYSRLFYEETVPPSLLALEMKRAGVSTIEEGNVIHTSTFSKILAPGLRLAWVIGPRDVIRHYVNAKQGIDLHTSGFVQQVVYEVVKDGFLQEHLSKVRQVYQKRRDTMLAALAATMPAAVSWNKPLGGLFLWLQLPPHIDTAQLLETAKQRRVAFIPGAAFYATHAESGRHTMRLNFSNVSESAIREGISRLAEVIRTHL